MNSILLQLALIALTLTCAVLLAAPADAQDAALVAQTVTGDSRTVEALGYTLHPEHIKTQGKLYIEEAAQNV